jgi:thiamine transport system substrate-binding protein
MNRRPIAAMLALVTMATAAGCGGDSSTVDGPVTVRLLTYEGFAAPPALAAFTARTGITVEIATSPDAGTLVNKAILSAENPEGDVLWGLDNTLLSRALDTKTFEPYQAVGLDQVDEQTAALVPSHEVTPVDNGDVCLNVDTAWFSSKGIAAPESLEALARPEYQDLLVVPDAAASTPGLAFMLSTVARFGADGFAGYWESLRANGLLVVDSWSTAYFTEFTASGGGGTRPIVVSYASSPPYPLIAGADPKPTMATTAAVLSTCFRQVEFAGILKGTKHRDAARQVIDLFLSEEFQKQLPESNFVYPVRVGIELPQAFEKYGQPSPDPFRASAADIAAHRDEWLETWKTAAIG